LKFYTDVIATPLNWIEPGEKVIFGPDFINEDEATIYRIQDNLKTVKSCQESYANKRHRPLEVTDEGREEVWVKGKLAPDDIGPFSILEKCGTVAYKLDLSPSLAGVHNIFHVLQLKKCPWILYCLSRVAAVAQWGFPLLQCLRDPVIWVCGSPVAQQSLNCVHR
jgi:hypothetical protein